MDNVMMGTLQQIVGHLERKEKKEVNKQNKANEVSQRRYRCMYCKSIHVFASDSGCGMLQCLDCYRDDV